MVDQNLVIQTTDGKTHRPSAKVLALNKMLSTKMACVTYLHIAPALHLDTRLSYL